MQDKFVFNFVFLGMARQKETVKIVLSYDNHYEYILVY